tara:strand:+ start:648 stop:1091 length:444 start_codon:yes stop_codon:yes gene_type:complete
MSSNRLIYDECEYKTRINESVGPLEYMLNPAKYENCNKCRMELGVIGGTAVSHIKGNLVDLETDLKGITRKASLCPTQKFSSSCAKGNMASCNPGNITIRGDTCGQTREIDTSKLHLPSCNMIRYAPVSLPPPLNINNCGVRQNKSL